MSLVINAPNVERTLQQEATNRGVTAADYAVDILTAHLRHQESDSAVTAVPFYATATPEQWTKAFDEWVDSHPARQPLPDSAMRRESFYEGHE
jgi:hypothetical protein